MSSAKKAVVVGAGYIGIEAAIAYAQAGIDVTVVDFVDSILPTYLDSEFTSLLTKHMEEKGMKIKTGEGVKEFKVNENNEVTEAKDAKGIAVPPSFRSTSYESDEMQYLLSLEQPDHKIPVGLENIHYNNQVLFPEWLLADTEWKKTKINTQAGNNLMGSHL